MNVRGKECLDSLNKAPLKNGVSPKNYKCKQWKISKQSYYC